MVLGLARDMRQKRMRSEDCLCFDCGDDPLSWPWDVDALRADPATLALDVTCKAYDLDNLYVVDGAFMPSIGAVNPALTIIANAMRVAEHIASRLTA